VRGSQAAHTLLYQLQKTFRSMELSDGSDCILLDVTINNLLLEYIFLSLTQTVTAIRYDLSRYAFRCNFKFAGFN
jgi:hypothetical protein